MAEPRYCVMCNSIRVTSKKKMMGSDYVVVEFMSNGSVVKTLPQMELSHPMTLTINTYSFVDVEKPQQSTVEDLMSMLAEKKG